jgi:hypothetical protein
MTLIIAVVAVMFVATSLALLAVAAREAAVVKNMAIILLKARLPALTVIVLVSAL